MKQKNLFEQMNRMKTLMNVKVLNEQTTAAIEKATEELWSVAKRLFSKGTERTAEESVENAVRKIETLVDRESRQYLENLTRNITEKGVENVEKELIQFLSKSKLIQQQIIKDLEINYEKEVNELIVNTAKSPEIRQTFDDLYSQALRYAGGDIEKAQNTLREILADDLTDTRILEKYFESVEAYEDNLGNWIIKGKGENLSEPTIPTEPEVDTAGDGEGISNYLKKIKNFSGNVVKTFTEIIGETNLSDLQDMVQIFKRMFKNPKELQLQFNEYVESILDKTARPNSGKFGQEYSQDVLKCAQIVASIRNKMGSVPETFFNEWKASLSKTLPPTEYAKIKRVLDIAQTEGRTKELFEQALKQRKILDPLKVEYNAFKEAWPFRMPGFSKSKGVLFFKNPKEVNWGRLRNFVLTMDARTMKEWKNVLISRGAKADVAANILFRYGTHALLVPVYVESLKFCFRASVASVESLVNLFKEEDVNWVNFNEEGLPPSQALEVIKKEWIDNIRKELPELTSVPWDIMSSTFNLWDNTFLDDIWNRIIAPFIVGLGGVFSKENEEELRKKLDEYGKKSKEEWEKFKNTLTEEQRKIAEEYERLHKIGEDVINTEGDTEAWFTAWCVKNGKNKKEWISSTSGNYGVTTDGIKWKYNKDTKGFDEIKESNTGENYTNDVPGFIKWFTEVKKMKLSQEDLPYIKSAGNNIYTFEDANGTIYKYEYSGTTFKDKTN